MIKLAESIEDIFAEYEKPDKKEEKVEKEEEKEEEEPKEEKTEEPEEEPKEEESKEEPKPKEEPKEEVKEPETKEEVKEEPKEEPKEEKEPEKPKEESNTSFLKQKVSTDEEFDLSPAKEDGKHIIMVYGLKGSGKTTLSFSFPETHGCLSFDNKSAAIAKQTGKVDSILVFDGSRYMDKSSPEAWLESAEKSWRYLNKLLDTVDDNNKPDWMVVDGGEIFHSIAEMVMRYRNNLMPFQGISNKNIWKERRMYIDQLLRKCLKKSKKGVIWTSYIDERRIVKEGEFVALQEIPRWIDAVMTETDVVIKVERDTDEKGQTFFATVESSKWPSIPESSKTEVTNGGIKKLIKGEV